MPLAGPLSGHRSKVMSIGFGAGVLVAGVAGLTLVGDDGLVLRALGAGAGGLDVD